MDEKEEMTYSMSRRGNGPIENLWEIIKTEMYYINGFNNIQETEKEINNYIEFYNKVRLHNKLKSHTPI